MSNFLYRLVKTYFWLVPRKLLIICYRSFFLLDNKIGVRLNLALLFTPLFGDPTIAGRFIGFVYRLIVIVVGSVIIFWGEVFCILLFIGYFYSFYFAYLLDPTLLFLYLVSLVFVFAIKYSLVSLVEFGEFVEGENPEKLVHPASRKFLKQILDNSFVNNPELLKECLNIVYLLLKFDLSIVELSKFLILQVGNKVDRVDLINKGVYVGKESGANYIGEEVLFVSYLELFPKWNEFLVTQKIEKSWLLASLKYVYWIKKKRRPVFFWDEDYKVPYMGGINRGLTSRVTPILNQYATDLTALASRALLAEPVGRKEIRNKVIEILSRPSKNNVLIVGNPGSGRTSFMNAIAYEIVRGTPHKSLKFKRLVSLEPGAFFGSGRGSSEMVERFNSVISELTAVGGIIAFIDEIHTLASVGVDTPLGSPIFGILEPKLALGNFQFIATTTPVNYHKYIEPHKSFSRVFEKVELPPATDTETAEILQINSFATERTKNIVISYPAIALSLAMSKQVIFDRELPDSAIDILELAISKALSAKSPVVGRSHVQKAVEEITKIPKSFDLGNNREKLLNLEQEIHQQVISQNEAIIAVSDALRREVTGVRNRARPIASFLFLGPTGVGKTETAKATARVFYGGAFNIVRYNLNQFIEKSRVTNLIDNLCNDIKEKPFSLILLDEFEKAHPELVTALLQLLDEGYLTNSQGDNVKFNNSLIVATSNIGSHEIFNVLNRGGSFEEMQAEATAVLKNKLSPELINRFSAVVVYKPLSHEDVIAVCRLKLTGLCERLAMQGIELEFSEDLIVKISSLGYSPEYGAREMERVLQDKVEAKLAKMIIVGELRRGSKFTVTDQFIDG